MVLGQGTRVGKVSARRDGGVAFAELGARSNFSLLDGASHPEELVKTAAALGLAGLAVYDTNSLGERGARPRRGQMRGPALHGRRPVRDGVISDSVLAGASGDLLLQVLCHRKVMMARRRIPSPQKETISGSRDLTLDCRSDHQFSWHPKPG